mmetsp:Transcript_25134/g.28932  ORF Transcript_25134/g.28932 Transcript_25134/m.28932 type:complete len:207 (-) Transcript_25134:41-661(-)
MGGSSSKEPDLFDLAFEMQFQAKQLDKQAAKIESGMKKEEAKILKLMSSGNHDAARISAENAMRMKGEALNTRRLAAQMGAVSMKLKSAERTKEISKTIKTSVPIIQKGLKEMDRLGINKAMSQFENIMEELDVKSDSLNNELEGVHASSISQSAVDKYLEQLQDSQVNDIKNNSGHVKGGEIGAKESEDLKDSDDLMARLKALQD